MIDLGAGRFEECFVLRVLADQLDIAGDRWRWRVFRDGLIDGDEVEEDERVKDERNDDGDADPAASCSDLDNGTEPDLPLADLDLDLNAHHSGFGGESATRVAEMGVEPDLTRTRVASADDNDELALLREERNRLRDELDALHESAERTVVTRDRTEILEADLHLARADNVRLAAEREEVGRAVEGLMNLLRERDLALVEAARQRDESRAAFDLAESARLILADDLKALRHSCEVRGLDVPRLSSHDYAGAEDSVR